MMNLEAERWATLCAAIDEAYKTFSRYELTGPILCEMTDRVIVAEGVGLRARVAGDFERYQWKAITTLGRVEDYKHFLPRLLELGAARRRREVLFRDEMTCDERSMPHVELGRVPGKLAYGEARNWPSEEVETLRRFGVAWWWWELALPPQYGGGIGEALNFLQAIGLPFGAFLENALGRMLDVDFLSVSRFVNSTIGIGSTLTSWSDQPDDESEQFERWLLGEQFGARLDEAFFSLRDREGATEVSTAAEYLYWRRKAAEVK